MINTVKRSFVFGNVCLNRYSSVSYNMKSSHSARLISIF